MGIHIPKDRIPQAYAKYTLTNLWKVNLPSAWRLLYTLQGRPEEITLFVIDILDHKSYEKMFKY